MSDGAGTSRNFFPMVGGGAAAGVAQQGAAGQGAQACGPDADASAQSFQALSISLPKGGGAIRGIGEKFAANPVTGTGSLTVPIAVIPSRSGFGPQLTLSCDSGSGNGNGPLGFGWSLSLPAISRKTDLCGASGQQRVRARHRIRPASRG